MVKRFQSIILIILAAGYFRKQRHLGVFPSSVTIVRFCTSASIYSTSLHFVKQFEHNQCMSLPGSNIVKYTIGMQVEIIGHEDGFWNSYLGTIVLCDDQDQLLVISKEIIDDDGELLEMQVDIEHIIPYPKFVEHNLCFWDDSDVYSQDGWLQMEKTMRIFTPRSYCINKIFVSLTVKVSPLAYQGQGYEQLYKHEFRLFFSGDVKSNLEINIKFINSLGETWITVQMIIQCSGKLIKMSLYELFNDLQAQDSTVLSNSVRSGGPLALLSADTFGATSDHASQKTRTKTQVVAEVSSLSYEDSEEDDEEDEAFQQELALLTHKFNPSSRNFRRNSDKRPYQKSFQKSHYTQYQKDAVKTASAGPSADQGKGAGEEDEIRCHNCQGLNHFARDCKARRKEEETGSKAYYLA
ncbi:hypothetical protein LXL04_003762 [Taraxacum kok-saghyz]